MTTTSEVVPPPSADINTKYQKLATEYAKLRAQMVVLKKGLLDEQEKSVRLGEEVHTKDMAIRKRDGEMEAVLFRNQQLTKRVNVLQDEAEAQQRNKGRSVWGRRSGAGDKERDRSHSKDRSSNSSLLSVGGDSAETVISEELVSKIQENAELRVKLADIETTYCGTIQALRERVSDLEKEAAVATQGNKARESEVASSLSVAEKEVKEAGEKMEALQGQLREKEDTIVQLQVQLSSALERCEGLELESSKAGPHTNTQATQYTFVDEDKELLQQREARQMESLQQRLSTALGKMKDLEKDREHWKLEFQLIQLKMEKLKNEKSSSLNSLPDAMELELEEVLIQREEELKSVYESKIEELIASRILADSKAISHFLELEAVSARLYARQREGEKLYREASTARLEEDKVREEIAVTKENYETQLSVMSEHLASMNSKLAEQEEIISQLRFEVSGKSTKKGKK